MTYPTSRLLSGSDTDIGSSFGSLAWTYDKNGNRQSETRNAGTMPYVYSPPNWLWQKGSETRYRTAGGNTQNTGTASFAYDGYDRLATSTAAAETVKWGQTRYSRYTFGYLHPEREIPWPAFPAMSSPANRSTSSSAAITAR